MSSIKEMIVTFVGQMHVTVIYDCEEWTMAVLHCVENADDQDIWCVSVRNRQEMTTSQGILWTWSASGCPLKLLMHSHWVNESDYLAVIKWLGKRDYFRWCLH